MIALLLLLANSFAGLCEDESLTLVPTRDGAAICMERHHGDGPPILLVHGISANRHFWNLDPAHSLPIHLQKKGFDVWNIDLRGRGGATKNIDGQRLDRLWTIDDYGRYDIDAAIEQIFKSRPGERIGFVGHSLGGMALASYLNERGDERLNAIVILASPMDFQHRDTLLKWASQAIDWNPFHIPVPFLSKIAALLPVVSGSIDRMIWNTKEMNPETRKKLMNKIVAPMTRNELKHISKSIHAGEYQEAKQDRDHAKGLKNIDTPALFIAGRADQIVPVDRCLSYYEAIGSHIKSFVIAGEAWGFSYDYGHSDYTMSRAVQTEIYPLISNWMNRYLNDNEGKSNQNK